NGSDKGHAYVLKAGVLTTIDFPGALGSAAHGLNDHGDVVGYYSFENPKPHAPAGNAPIYGFLYRDGAFQTIAFPGAHSTLAIRVNNRGDIAGIYRSSPNASFKGFVLIGGHYLSVEFSSGTYTAYGLNDHRQLAGSYYSGSSSQGFVAQVLAGPK
ncbi:MAG: hypothetical protein HY821_21870, partial [Acidobacteria bacterium]|nr:hypothetical protein [Acidobacteriota bacterium]